MPSKAALLTSVLLIATAVPITSALAKVVNGAVFTMTNSAVRGNQVVAFERRRDGSLSFVDAFSTGGKGPGRPRPRPC